MLKLIFTAILCFCVTIVFSQDNELSALASVERPQGDLGTIYASAPLFQISYAKTDTYKKKYKSSGISFGYMSMNPIKPTIKYQVPLDTGGTGTATASYSTYRSYQLMANLKSGWQLGESVLLFLGADIGLNFTTYDYSLHMPGLDEDGSIRIMRYVVAPKLGVSVALTKSVDLLLQSRYVMSLGKNDNEDSILNTYLSLGGGLSFKF
jgi:opacity protein-like surface antigen